MTLSTPQTHLPFLLPLPLPGAPLHHRHEKGQCHKHAHGQRLPRDPGTLRRATPTRIQCRKSHVRSDQLLLKRLINNTSNLSPPLLPLWNTPSTRPDHPSSRRRQTLGRARSRRYPGSPLLLQRDVKSLISTPKSLPAYPSTNRTRLHDHPSTRPRWRAPPAGGFRTPQTSPRPVVLRMRVATRHHLEKLPIALGSLDLSCPHRSRSTSLTTSVRRHQTTVRSIRTGWANGKSGSK